MFFKNFIPIFCLNIYCSWAAPSQLTVGNEMLTFSSGGDSEMAVMLEINDDNIGDQGSNEVNLTLEYVVGSPDFSNFVTLGGEGLTSNISVTIEDDDDDCKCC